MLTPDAVAAPEGGDGSPPSLRQEKMALLEKEKEREGRARPVRWRGLRRLGGGEIPAKELRELAAQRRVDWRQWRLLRRVVVQVEDERALLGALRLELRRWQSRSRRVSDRVGFELRQLLQRPLGGAARAQVDGVEERSDVAAASVLEQPAAARVRLGVDGRVVPNIADF